MSLPRFLPGYRFFLIVLLVKIFLFRQSFVVLLIVIFLIAQTFKMVFDEIQIIQRANHHSKRFIVGIITQSIIFFLLNILFLVVLDMNYQGGHIQLPDWICAGGACIS